MINASQALICNNVWGPIFGRYDIEMNPDNIWTSTPKDYPNLNIPNNFEINDYEVFQVVKIM